MKRTISLILCLLLLLALCSGCSFASDKNGKDAPAQENAAETDGKDESGSGSAEAPAGSKEDAEAEEPASTEWPGNSSDGELPEIEIPFEDEELVDPSELSPAEEQTEPEFVPDEDLITDNDDIRIDENGDTVLPEIP